MEWIWRGVIPERFERRRGISFAPLLFGVPDRFFIFELLLASLEGTILVGGNVSYSILITYFKNLYITDTHPKQTINNTLAIVL